MRRSQFSLGFMKKRFDFEMKAIISFGKRILNM